MRAGALQHLNNLFIKKKKKRQLWRPVQKVISVEQQATRVTEKIHQVYDTVESKLSLRFTHLNDETLWEHLLCTRPEDFSILDWTGGRRAWCCCSVSKELSVGSYNWSGQWNVVFLEPFLGVNHLKSHFSHLRRYLGSHWKQLHTVNRVVSRIFRLDFQ